MRLDATKVQLEQEVTQTSEDIRLRYRLNRDWRLYPKEWIFRNIALKGKDVLDFGCGTGEIATQIAFLGANLVYALDITPGLLESTRRRAELDGVADRIQTVCGMVQDIEPRPVDVIVAFAVLHHCSPLESIIPWLLRWLKPGGVFVAVEPSCYLARLEWLRNHSGIPYEPLDEGERKLRAEDLQYVASHFPRSQTIHFHLLGRLSRIWPKGDRLYRRVDRMLLRAPMAWKFAGTTLILGQS
jgi:2-polyprenyl-3-methyl-5-hydroxy-6-metoxy-1,4-benzoquinol methylase